MPTETATKQSTVLGPEAEFRRHLAEGRFMVQRCAASGRHVFPPRVAEPGSGAALQWVMASGAGTVHSTSVVRRKPPAADYNVALIDLAEGPRLMSTVLGMPADHVRIGMAVIARIDSGGEAPRIVFEPAIPAWAATHSAEAGQ
ncbi:Zn-ribbon domain-containing OB-fold protein [Aquabacterium sp.]|uniref:Zn-ribbon domain-containing OB-fold protein n=1 Tax=Aquabacterium sp. TaxID=1872578 RepID=UPI002B576B76|nr:OB-fold domain-containing protein [Aquabacterium sp.]HSW06039.1 OB-fold domain-containing protein [Aquabacterium sp.]